ncbi:RNA-binding protein 1-like [Ananas comosus]|uniref:RNA-binding protein 1-like n=1 Tax=Ananas comosus TaxID=4615 RepID=A0A6P5FJV7_ANACO|nr:RNA-binding protein 1-like [Ananas comosus]
MEASSSSSEPGKLFVGGISSETEETHLREYFEKYGAVKEAVVVKERGTGKVRGFAFVEFSDAAAAERVLEEKERTKTKHVICGKEVDVKRAYPRSERNQNHHYSQNGYPNQSPHQNPSPSRRFFNNNNFNGGHSDLKIFVGGLPATTEESNFKRYFEKFGTINDVVVMHDSNTQKSRGFGFITFDSPDAVKEVLKNNFHQLDGKNVEVKIAEPKQENNNNHSGNFTPRTFGRRVPPFGGYQGSMYPHPPYDGGYGLYPGYAAPPFPGFPYAGGGYPAGYAMGNYGGVSYGHHYTYPYPYPRGPWNGYGMMDTQSPVLYGNGPMYPNYVNGGGFGSYAPMASGVYNPENGLTNGEPVAHGGYYVDNGLSIREPARDGAHHEGLSIREPARDGAHHEGLSNREPAAAGAYHVDNGLSNRDPAADGPHRVENGSSNGEAMADTAHHVENALSNRESAEDGASYVENDLSNGEGNQTSSDVQSQVTGGTATAPTETVESDQQ